MGQGKLNVDQEIQKGKEIEAPTKKLFGRIKSKKGKLDPMFQEKHDEAFKSIDCLDCANCCKTTSPIFRPVDVKRLSKSMRMNESRFIDEYLRIDEDNDYVLKTAPCPFLDLESNKCNVYENRPLACREYPHTDRKNMYQILDLTLKNLMVCPAVVKICDSFLETTKGKEKRKS